LFILFEIFIFVFKSIDLTNKLINYDMQMESRRWRRCVFILESW